MSAHGIPSADNETRLRDAALVLLDLAIAATPAHSSEKARVATAYGLAVQALLMAEELRPGAAIVERLAKLGNCDMLVRIGGAAEGVGQTIGCLRSQSGQDVLIVAAVRQLGAGVARRNQTMREMGFQ